MLKLKERKEIERIQIPSVIENILTKPIQKELIELLENLLLDSLKKDMDKENFHEQN